MTSFVNHFKQLAPNDAVLYHCDSKTPSVGIVFNEALNPKRWRDNFSPFACAIVHNNSNETILVRDHLGIEPLYYYHQVGKKVIYADNIPAILQQLSSTPPLVEKQINLLFSHHKIYSDETWYQGIYRVEPGTLVHFKADGTKSKIPYWQLDPHGPLLQYADDRDYLDHFSTLMNEAIVNAVTGHSNIAAEFSAGLDTCAVYCAVENVGIRPTLYMHIDAPDENCTYKYNDYYEKAFVEHYNIKNIQRIGADNFDPIEVFDEYAQWFAGPAPYLFPMFANPVHCAVAAGKHPILLSGFGGDQCLSGQLPLNFYLPELIHQRQYRQAWNELKGKSRITKAFNFAMHLHPSLYLQAQRTKIIKRHLVNMLKSKGRSEPILTHPYENMYYHSVPEVECALLQGLESHEVRMRVEYSGLVSKKMGFQYRYPLLYPKLLEFMLRVPTIQKRRDGRGRYLMRQYMAQFIPGEIFNAYLKKEGLGIVASTFGLYKNNYAQGHYEQLFKALPGAEFSRNQPFQIQIRNSIKGYMLKPIMEKS